MRREFSNYVKAQAAIRANGKCEQCTARLLTGGYHYDHITADALGGEPTIDNCQVLCKACHGLKTTKADVPNIARAKRRERKHQGIKPKSRFPGSKDSNIKMKVGGGWEYRR
jgi:5-methylcytosine-specific restriction protein A